MASPRGWGLAMEKQLRMTTNGGDARKKKCGEGKKPKISYPGDMLWRKPIHHAAGDLQVLVHLHLVVSQSMNTRRTIDWCTPCDENFWVAWLGDFVWTHEDDVCLQYTFSTSCAPKSYRQRKHGLASGGRSSRCLSGQLRLPADFAGCPGFESAGTQKSVRHDTKQTLQAKRPRDQRSCPRTRCQ